MKLILSLAAFLTFALFNATSCEKASMANSAANNAEVVNKNAPNAVAQTDDAPRISLADAKKDFDAGSAIFVDTRAAEAYKNEHIKGSINIPAGDFETRYAELPKDKKIIAYCS